MTRLIPLALASFMMVVSGCATQAGETRIEPRYAETDHAHAEHSEARGFVAAANLAGAVGDIVGLAQDMRAMQPWGRAST